MSSEKKDKRILNRSLRARAKRLLRKNPEEFIMPKKEEIMDTWDMSKDRGG